MALYHTYLRVVYRVHDELWAALEERPTRVIPPGSDPLAAHRAFVTREGDVYAVQLLRDEWQHVDVASLDRLLAVALSHGRRMRRGEAIDVYLSAMRDARG